MLDLVWRPRAQLDRESIAIYLGVERSSPKSALSVMSEIDSAILRIRTFPDNGGHFHLDTLDHHDYRTVIAGKYTVYYRYDEDKVTIYRILHQRREIDVYTLVDF
ncbi:MAG: type II toxin-antitoxin system RelE/ParE family toxin [Eggerthellaceae bacterium]|nr:type II toxin-antitoxin system RelE/ParE family toxin [Eggerthellaceae bacterium]